MTDLSEAETKTVIVTGGASGIGAATCRRFAADGYRVVCADIDEEAAVAIATEIKGSGGLIYVSVCDVTNESSVDAMVKETLREAGRIDCLVSNAGAMIEGGILSLTLDEWRLALDRNATGAFLCARAALPHLIKTKGSIVFTASTVALSGMKGVAAYSAAKGAVAALARQLAADFAEEGIRVNAVAPGAVRTPLSESQFRARSSGEEELETLLSQVIQRYPIKRWGKAEEIAEAIHFLGSERAAWITGQIVPIDGGLLELR